MLYLIFRVTDESTETSPRTINYSKTFEDFT